VSCSSFHPAQKEKARLVAIPNLQNVHTEIDVGCEKYRELAYRIRDDSQKGCESHRCESNRAEGSAQTRWMESKSVPARCSDAMPETGRADREKRCEAVSGETKSRKKVRIEHRIECDEEQDRKASTASTRRPTPSPMRPGFRTSTPMRTIPASRTNSPK
jgi:hypothetical protein